MPHIMERAKSGRSKCRGCNTAIGKDEWRFGECLPNPFADSEDSVMTIWFHLECGALRRPEAFEEMIEHEAVTDVTRFRAWIDNARTHHRLPRINGAHKAPSGRAKCRDCQEMIAKDAWRIPLVFFEEGMFNASGFVHVSCAVNYFGTAEILDRLLYFSQDLDDSDTLELTRLLAP